MILAEYDVHAGQGDDVSLVQFRGVDQLSVHVGPPFRAQVSDLETPVLVANFGVFAGDLGVRHHQVIVGSPADEY